MAAACLKAGAGSSEPRPAGETQCWNKVPSRTLCEALSISVGFREMVRTVHESCNFHIVQAKP